MTTSIGGPPPELGGIDEIAVAPLVAPPWPPRPTPPPPRRARRRGRDLLRFVTAVLMLFAVIVGWSVGRAVFRTGTDSVAARVAEWARDHHLDPVVTAAEKVQYDLNKPKTGGAPAGGIPTAPGAEATTAPTVAPTQAPQYPHTPAPADVTPIGGQALAGEGIWQTVVTSHGLPAVEVTYLRPDATHTSYLVGAMWLDPKLVSGRLHPGTQDPGGKWQAPSYLTPELQRTAAAAFNAGFRLNGASHGGYYAEGRTALPLREGVASLVIKKDGTADVGIWGRDVKMSADVESVRQNLALLVEDGQVNPTCEQGNSDTWGYTLGNVSYVHRSGFGVKADGGLIYIGGPAMSVCSLGQVMKAAGVVRGMELDINPEWVTGAYYQHSATGQIDPHKLIDGEQKPADHYFEPSTRDFYSWSLRP
jgi:hypothetical protein